MISLYDYGIKIVALESARHGARARDTYITILFDYQKTMTLLRSSDLDLDVILEI